MPYGQSAPQSAYARAARAGRAPSPFGSKSANTSYGSTSPAPGGEAQGPTNAQAQTAQKSYYTFADSEVPTVASAKGGSYLRFIFWGGAGSYADNSSFFSGVKKLRKAYADGLIYDRPMCSGRMVVDNINNQNDACIKSLDFVCHGGPLALFFVSTKLADGTQFHTPMDLNYNFNAKYISEKNREKYQKSLGAAKYAQLEKATKTYVVDKIQSGLYSSGATRTFAPSYSFIFEEGPDAPRKFESTLSGIDFAKFANSSKVEVHGCRTAEPIPVFDDFCEQCSELMYDAGKARAVAIGHTTQSSPDENGDYRHGTRLCFHNGEILFRYEDPGQITESLIDKYIDQKSQGLLDDYYPKIKGGQETKVER